jgi:hypothetical protein
MVLIIVTKGRAIDCLWLMNCGSTTHNKISVLGLLAETRNACAILHLRKEAHADLRGQGRLLITAQALHRHPLQGCPAIGLIPVRAVGDMLRGQPTRAQQACGDPIGSKFQATAERWT